MDGVIHAPALGVLITPNPKGAGVPEKGGARAEPWICSVGGSHRSAEPLARGRIVLDGFCSSVFG